MSPLDRDRNLRRLVARLSAADPEDLELILEALDGAQRLEVRALLDAYAGPDGAPAAAPPGEAPPDVAHIAGLSPWLAARIAGGGPGAGAVTAAARAALGELARALPPAAPEDAAAPAPAPGGRGLLGLKGWRRRRWA